MTARISEDDLLAWIEGEATGDEAQRIEQALARDPQLRDWAIAARGDREKVRNWCLRAETDAPDRIVADAMENAQRRALLGDAAAPQIRIAHSGSRRWSLAPLAAAAAMILLATALVAMPMLRHRPAPAPAGGPMASLDDNSKRDAIESAPSPSLSQEPDTLALADASRTRETTAPEALRDAIPIVADADRGFGRSAKVSGESSGSGSDQTFDQSIDQSNVKSRALAEKAPKPVRRAMSSRFSSLKAQSETGVTIDEALALAGQGRLAIVADAAIEKFKLDELAKAAGSALRWSDHTGEPTPTPLVNLIGERPVHRYSVEMPLDRSSLEKLVQTLEQAGATNVRMTPLDEPVTPPQGIDTSEALWWLTPISQWRLHGVAQILIVHDVQSDALTAPDDDGAEQADSPQ